MYATYSDMVSRFPYTETRIGSATSVNSDLIAPAANWVNSKLGKMYTVPFSDVPGTVRDLTMDYAYYRFLFGLDMEKAKLFYEMQIESLLDALLSGEATLTTDSGTISPTPDNVMWSENADYDPVFSMLDSDNKYSRIDPDRLDNDEDERE
jgi:phage gp36-like protein